MARKRVARLMRKGGLVGRCPRRFRRTTIPDAAAHVVPDLVQRQFRPSAPNQIWLADISYIRTWEGWLYLAVILDAFSRKVVGWAVADHLRTELATAALQMALTTRRPPPQLIHHSDRGSQTEFKESSQTVPLWSCDATTQAAIRSCTTSPNAVTRSATGGPSRR